MFVIYAVVLGLILGLLAGGRLERLGELRFRWPWLALAGLATQVVLFSGAVDGRIGAAGPALYVGSTAVVLVGVLANLAIPGLALVAVGATSNLAAILANGGYMPADPGATAMAGLEPDDAFSNSVVTDAPALRPLTDIFALPESVPLANVFSIGDVAIGLGIAIAIATGMRNVRPRPAAGVPVHSGNSPD